MTALHTLGILSTSFTWNYFSSVLNEFPHMLITCWLLFLHSAVHLIPSQLGGQVIVEARSSDAALITLLLDQIALTQPGVVLGHCPVEKQVTVPLSAN